MGDRNPQGRHHGIAYGLALHRRSNSRHRGEVILSEADSRRRARRLGPPNASLAGLPHRQLQSHRVLIGFPTHWRFIRHRPHLLINPVQLLVFIYTAILLIAMRYYFLNFESTPLTGGRSFSHSPSDLAEQTSPPKAIPHGFTRRS